MKREVIKVSEGIYVPTSKVIEEILEDLLSKLKTCKVNSRDINGLSNYSCVYVKDNKVMRQTWDEDYHGFTTEDEFEVLTEDEHDVRIIMTACNLYKIYKNINFV